MIPVFLKCWTFFMIMTNIIFLYIFKEDRSVWKNQNSELHSVLIFFLLTWCDLRQQQRWVLFSLFGENSEKCEASIHKHDFYTEGVNLSESVSHGRNEAMTKGWWKFLNVLKQDQLLRKYPGLQENVLFHQSLWNMIPQSKLFLWKMIIHTTTPVSHTVENI